MTSLLVKVLVCLSVGVCQGYPGYPSQRGFFYQVGGLPQDQQLLASIRNQQHFVAQSDPYPSVVYHQQVPSFLQPGKAPGGLVYAGGRPVLVGTKDEESGGYVDQFLGFLGSYWPGQSPEAPQPEVTEGPATEEQKPEKSPKPEKAPKPEEKPLEPSNLVMTPALRAPQYMTKLTQQAAALAPQQHHFLPTHQEMMDSLSGNYIQPGSGAHSFQKMLAAARLKASQAGLKAAQVEEDAASVTAEEQGKPEEQSSAEETEAAEQEQYGPSIAQAKPQAVSVAGLGGVAAAAPVGTAVVGPGGMALSAPHATAVAGASKRPSANEEKLRIAAHRNPVAHIPPASYFLRY